MTSLTLDARKIPVTVLTGFLGSGKTTLLRHLLAHPGMEETAVIVNEFGEVGLDHHLLESSQEDTLLLDNGCLCCGLRGDLVATLTALLERRERGEVPAFSRVVIETTGLADPVPVLQTFRTDPLRLSLYELGGLVTCFDAVNGVATLQGHREAQRQLALADTVVLTKTDLCDAEAAQGAVTDGNGRARVVVAIDGVAEPVDILHPATNEMLLPEDHERGHHDHRDHDGIVSAVVAGQGPVSWDHVRQAVATLVEEHGDRLLRVKGLLAVEGQDGPILVDGVQHLFHRPRPLDAWPGGIERPFLVGIAEGASVAEIENWLGAVLRSAP